MISSTRPITRRSSAKCVRIRAAVAPVAAGLLVATRDAGRHRQIARGETGGGSFWGRELSLCFTSRRIIIENRFFKASVQTWVLVGWSLSPVSGQTFAAEMICNVGGGSILAWILDFGWGVACGAWATAIMTWHPRNIPWFLRESHTRPAFILLPLFLGLWIYLSHLSSPFTARRELMEYRYLGNSGLKVSCLGLGGWITFGMSRKYLSNLITTLRVFCPVPTTKALRGYQSARLQFTSSRSSHTCHMLGQQVSFGERKLPFTTRLYYFSTRPFSLVLTEAGEFWLNVFPFPILETCAECMRVAFENGVNYFDTAESNAGKSTTTKLACACLDW